MTIYEAIKAAFPDKPNVILASWDGRDWYKKTTHLEGRMEKLEANLTALIDTKITTALANLEHNALKARIVGDAHSMTSITGLNEWTVNTSTYMQHNRTRITRTENTVQEILNHLGIG